MKIGVVVPAHNEVERIERCLRSIRSAAKHPALSPSSAHVIVVADSCSDGTAGVARRHADTVLTCDARNVGIVRHRGCTAALDAGCEWIANTDADCVVPSQWLAYHVACAADVLCGTVRLGPSRWISREVREAYEAGYLHCDGHRHVHGANLGISAVAYKMLGGFAPLGAHEDVALLRAAESAGLRIEWCAQVSVTTSARMTGRASHGFACHIRRLAQESHASRASAFERIGRLGQETA